MAAASPCERLLEEATCPICLDLFTEPLQLDCGHAFCRACLARCWGEEAATAVCPLCRAGVRWPRWEANRQLAAFAEIARQFREQEATAAGAREEEAGAREEEAGAREEEEGVCPRHREPLGLFCKDDGAPICVACGIAKHRDHAVVPAEEAAEGYKEEVCVSLEILRKERETVLACTRDTKQEIQDLLKVTRSEREKTLDEFRKLHQFLEEQEQLLLGQMEEVEKEIARERDERLAILSKDLSSLESLIQEMEEKIQQPVRDFLKDIKSTLKRCEEKETAETPVAFPPEVKWRIWDLSDLNCFLESVMKQFKDNLESGLQQQEANVTLDPDTAHPHLAISVDQKSVGRGNKCQDLPDNPERFDKHCMVLGCERFSLGRHRWEVAVRSGEGWAIGVARTSVKRKGKFTASPEEGIWAVRTWKGAYKAFVSSLSSPLPFSGKLRRVRVCLNYTGGQVAFFDADTAAPLYTFSGISFSGETVQPYFWVKAASLSLLKAARLTHRP